MGIGDWTPLACPSCGHDYLHQTSSVEVYDRVEDAESGLRLSVWRDKDELRVSFGTSMTGCPSPRREGLTIQFWCENCDAGITLAIIQHKGQTFFDWMPLVKVG